MALEDAEEIGDVLALVVDLLGARLPLASEKDAAHAHEHLRVGSVIGRGDRLVVKRVQSLFNGQVVIKSDNPTFREETLSAVKAEEVRVIGRVHWIARMI